MNIKVKVCGRSFDLEKAVCNHGFFMMAPNRWNPSTKTLVRPLRLSDDLINPSLVSVSVSVSISQPSPNLLSITLLDRDPHANAILPSHRQAIVDQVRRMLRLSPKDNEQMKEFHRLHVTAAKDGFGRLFRNPCLFEDIVKTWLLCGCRFRDSLAMAEGLCMVQKRLSKKRKRGRRRREEEEEAWGNFPSAAELASLDRKTLLVMECNLGYRDVNILEFSKDVRDGKISLAELENISDGDELYSKLYKIQGIGDFVSCNILMCMGFYHRLPIDSETIRHIKQVHRKDGCKTRNAKKMVEEIYDKYAPFQTLAYWLELVEYYEYHLGKLSLLDSRDYKRVAGTTIDRLVN